MCTADVETEAARRRGGVSGGRRLGGRVVAVPEAVRRKALARGAEGRLWLEGLRSLIRELERGWGVTVGRTLSGGSESYVAAVRTPLGGDAVVKLEMPPYASFASEAKTLAAADGRGYVRLLDSNEGRHAMLLERLGPSLGEAGLPVRAQIEAHCAALRRAWEVPAPEGLPSGAEKARWLSGFIAATWEELDRPCSRRVIGRALAFAESREPPTTPEPPCSSTATPTTPTRCGTPKTPPPRRATSSWTPTGCWPNRPTTSRSP